jgi:hypothetical protein
MIGFLNHQLARSLSDDRLQAGRRRTPAGPRLRIARTPGIPSR